MPDEKRIITMTRIAIYEKGIGKEDLRLRKYSRGDYAALTLIRTFIFTSIGYAIVLGLVVLGNSEYLLENIDKMRDKTVIIVTHRPAALGICDYQLHIENGRMTRTERMAWA